MSHTYHVRMGHAPIPTTALKPKALHPLDSRMSLFNYIRDHGVMAEYQYEDEQRARDVAETFKIPATSVWAKQIVQRSTMKGLPEQELLFKSGIKQ